MKKHVRWYLPAALAAVCLLGSLTPSHATIDATLNTTNYVSGQASELSVDGVITSGGASTSINGATLQIRFDSAKVALSGIRCGLGGWAVIASNTTCLSEGWVRVALGNSSGSAGEGQTNTGPIMYFTVTPVDFSVDADDCDTLRLAGADSDLSDQDYYTIVPSDPCNGINEPSKGQDVPAAEQSPLGRDDGVEDTLPQPTACQIANALQVLRISGGLLTATTADVRTLDYSGDGMVTIIDAEKALRAPCGPPTYVVAAATGADDAGNPKIVVYWTPVPGATSYDVFRRDEGQQSSHLMATVTQSDANLSYPGSGYLWYRDVDPTKVENTEYYYTVRAANAYADAPASQEVAALVNISEVPWDTVPWNGSDQSSAIWLILYRFVTGVPNMNGRYSLPNPITITGPDGLNYDCSYDEVNAQWQYTVYGPQGSYDAATNTYIRNNGESFQMPCDGLSAEIQGSQLDRTPNEIIDDKARGPYRRVRSTDTGNPVGAATVVHLPMASETNQIWVRAPSAIDNTPYIYLGHSGYINGLHFEECDAGIIFNTGAHNWSLFAKGDKPAPVGWTECSNPKRRISTASEIKYVTLYWATGGTRLGGLLSAAIFTSDLSFEKVDAVGRFSPYRGRNISRKMKRMVTMAQQQVGVRNPLGSSALLSDVGMSGNSLYWPDGSSGYWGSNVTSEDGAHTLGVATVTVEGTLVNEYPIRVYIPES